MRTQAGRLAAFMGFVFLCAGILGAQTVSEDELTEALAGLVSAVMRAEASDDRGQNLDSSLRWEPFGDGSQEASRVYFDNFRYYIAGENPARVVTLNGRIEIEEADEDFISGNLAVNGIPSLSSIGLERLDLDEGASGAARVNNRSYDGEAFVRLLEAAADIAYEDERVVNAEIEAGVVFYAMLTAMDETDLTSRLDEVELPGNDILPEGIRTSNEKGTVNILTHRNSFDLSLVSHRPRNLPFDNFVPVLDGNVVIAFEVESQSSSFDGSLRIGNMPFVSSMRFDACRLVEGASGNIVINGQSHSFQDFIQFVTSSMTGF
jgi:hypothetical protein